MNKIKNQMSDISTNPIQSIETKVYVVKKIYGCGWKCSKSSYCLSEEITHNINHNMLTNIYINKRKALISAYILSVLLYCEQCKRQKKNNIKYPNITRETDEEITELIKLLQNDISNDDLYYSYEVVECDLCI